MCVYLCVCVSVLRVGGGCVKEEVLSGTEAFCRCCMEEGLNGNLWLSAPWKHSLTRKGMPRVAPSQTRRCRFGLADGGTEGLLVPSDRWVEKL